MLLQPHNPPPIHYASPLRCNVPSIALPRSPVAFRRKATPAITCSMSPPVPKYGTTEFKRKPMVKWYWKNVYKKISSMENSSETGTAAELDQFEESGALNKWKLRMVVKELRKYRLYKQALEVLEWMISKGDRFRLSPTDVSIQLDLISRVHGISRAEDFFMQLPKSRNKDKLIHMALLNTYVRCKMIDKAESFMSSMRNNGYANDAPPFNVMMTLYRNLKEYDKVEALVSEMMCNNIKLDECSYNIWLLSHGSQGSTDSMEEVFEQMKLDSSVKPGWNTFCTMCSIYIQMGLMEKAEECLRSAETLIKVRDWIPYHSLISLYAGIGKKDEIYRLWSTYRSIFPAIPSLGYRTVISALTRVGDIEGAENMYKEWQSARASRDPKVGNLLINWYVKEGLMEKAEAVFDGMVEVGAKPNSSTWEILAEGYIAERRIKEALSCYEEAASIDGSSWRPSPKNVSALMDLCKEGGEKEAKQTLLELLGRSKFIKDGLYASRFGFSSSNNGVLVGSDDEGGY